MSSLTTSEAGTTKKAKKAATDAKHRDKKRKKSEEDLQTIKDQASRLADADIFRTMIWKTVLPNEDMPVDTKDCLIRIIMKIGSLSPSPSLLPSPGSATTSSSVESPLVPLQAQRVIATPSPSGVPVASTTLFDPFITQNTAGQLDVQGLLASLSGVQWSPSANVSY